MGEKITFGERLGYGLGDLATMILAMRIWDNINDPIFGIIADRTNSRWGKFRPYLLWGALPSKTIATDLTARRANGATDVR